MEIRGKSMIHKVLRAISAHVCLISVVAMGVAACGSAPGEGAEGTPGSRTSGSAQAVAPTAEGTAGTPQEARPPRGTAWVIFGADTVLAEVARDPDTRAQGLMYREELPENTGMLFMWDNNQQRSFWMSNTYVALDIAYMDPSYTVIDIQQMEPLTTTPHESTGPAMFALEVPVGWFAAHDIAVGAKAQVVFGLQ